MPLDGEVCRTGKSCYPSIEAAERSVRNIKRFGDRKQSSPQRAYRCPQCRWVHVSSEAEWDTWWED